MYHSFNRKIFLCSYFSPHPYLFFNSDRFTFTFLGFYIDRASGSLVDQQTGANLEQGIMTQNLFDALQRNQVPLRENFDALPRYVLFVTVTNVDVMKC